jgi:MFS family permease
MMAEFLPSDRRGRWLVLLESFWAVGTILLAILALIAVSRGDDAWRLIFLVTGIPALVGVVFRFFVPESPLYLNKSGRSAEARAVLQRVATANRVSVEIGNLEPQPMERKSVFALFARGCRRRTDRLLRRLRLSAGQAGGPGLWLHAWPGLPDCARAGAASRVRAGRARRRALGPQADADRLPAAQRGRLHAL